ncbi:nicotinate (nicotinamide) nucleotide adenylyltransferase [Halocola ammonii]
MKKRIGLYFGTFNPVHVGHLIIANFMADFTDLDQVWLVVSPQNPLKQKSTLLADHHRLELVRIAVEDNDNLRASNIEFELTKPSYTMNTLTHLEEKHPDYTFSLIMGEDNLRTLHKWRNHEQILERHDIYVYPRVPTAEEQWEGVEVKRTEFHDHPKVHLIDGPVMKVSASYIRKAIKDGKDVRYLLTNPVEKYVREMHFYES